MSTILLSYLMSQQLYQQSQQFGQATADQLANSVVDHLVKEDLLSLNLLVRNAIANKHFDFVSVYNRDNNLLAQAGRNHPRNRFFTQQVTVQNIVSGYVEVGFNASLMEAQVVHLVIVSIILHCLVLLLVAGMGWRFGDLMYLWVMGPEKLTLVASADVLETTILVAKLKPAHLLPTYQGIFSQALALHAGEVVQTGDNLTVQFGQPEQILQAIRAAQLLIYLTRLLPNVAINIGLHQSADKSELARAMKQSSYLASNSDNQILTSRVLKEGFEHTEKFNLAPYHSAMTPDGEVFLVEPLRDQALLIQQAAELIKST